MATTSATTDLSGQVAIVTGAASGIGAASARHLASLGAHVVAVDLAEAGVRSLADEIGGTAAVLDVADTDAWESLIGDVRAEHGGIDLAHLNAGILTMPHPYSVLEVTLAQYRRVMGVNLDGVLLPVLLLAAHMRHRGGGAIVATASLAGLGPYADDPFYAATKHAVVGFVRSAAPQLAAEGVRIHAICPGAVRTALIDDFIQARLDAGGRGALDPAEVAVAVAEMLASPSAGLVRTIVEGRGTRDHPFGGDPMPGPGT